MSYLVMDAEVKPVHLDEPKNVKIENRSYTIIYRDTDGELKESWHHLNDTNIDWVKKKYKKQGKEILRFVEKELPFGVYLGRLAGGSK